MLAEDFIVFDASPPLWNAMRPYVEAVLRLEQNEGPPIWHGWDKQQIDAFLQRLPSPCSLLVAVWETVGAVEHGGRGQDPSLDAFKGRYLEKDEGYSVGAAACPCPGSLSTSAHGQGQAAAPTDSQIPTPEIP